MVAGFLLLLHLLFGMHFHSNLDLGIPFLLLNLSSRLGFLKFVMILSYRMMMFLQDDNVVLQFCRFRILLLFLLCKALLDHWELALYKYCILYITLCNTEFFIQNSEALMYRPHQRYRSINTSSLVLQTKKILLDFCG